jgi:hypothetical protein
MLTVIDWLLELFPPQNRFCSEWGFNIHKSTPTLFRKGNWNQRNTPLATEEWKKDRKTLVNVPSIARLTVWQQEHCTLVAPRMYIRRVWHPPQTSCAISVPAPNPGGKFIRATALYNIVQLMLSFLGWFKGVQSWNLQLYVCTLYIEKKQNPPPLKNFWSEVHRLTREPIWVWFKCIPGAGTVVTVLQTAQHTDGAPAGYMSRFRHPEQTSWLWAPEIAQAWNLSLVAESHIPITEGLISEKQCNGKISREISMA